ncbi:hypothetical protein [Variovorax terrae]|uniref:Uncharacterized protein n=1 Tax=Variovorax terrae TaxID=2923278 RepID=A0A9X2AQ87_9BURK|nr:hypothetical protein [Variovorax terrae]MCJ0764302.1 hypothetical protein [Variovorax terrae]
MHSAPSVTYPVGRSRWAGRLALALWLAGAGAAALWLLQPGAAGWRQALALAAVLAAGAAALQAWRTAPQGELHWDGRQWLWSRRGGPQQPGLVTVHLDLQRCLLLRLQILDGRVRWLWLEPSFQPGRWNDLRRAVYSRASRQAPADLRDRQAAARP